MTDYLWIGLIIAWMKRLTEEQRILFDGREDNPVKENGGAEVDIILSRPYVWLLISESPRSRVSAQYDAVMWNESCY